MNDRELLDLAAKAASIPLDYWNDGSEPYSSGEGFILPSNAIWNPLTDDGDALRLSVKLKIDIKQYDDHVVGWFDGGYTGTGNIPYDGDPLRATRRAIVRAAAEIGKEMK